MIVRSIPLLLNFIGESTVIPATIRGIREGKITAVFDKDDTCLKWTASGEITGQD